MTDIMVAHKFDDTQFFDANPAYDAAGEVTIRHGPGQASVGSQYRGTGTANCWQMTAMKLDLYPGTYTLSHIYTGVGYSNAANCDAILFRMYQKVGTNLVYQSGTEVDLTSVRHGTNISAIINKSLGDIEITIGASEEWYYAIALHLASGGTSVGQRYTTAGQGPDDEAYVFQEAAALIAAVGALPTTISVNGIAYDDEVLMGELVLTTSNRIIYEGAYSSANIVTIPRIDTEDHWVKFEDALVADGQAFTCLLQNENGSGVMNTLETMVLDMGGTDQVTFNGNSIALAGAGAEAGATFDLGVNIRPATDKVDLFWIDREVGQGGQGAIDIATICHSVKNGAARGSDYAMATRPMYLNMSGTAAVTTIQVGWEPLIIFGDSQAGTTTSSINVPIRLGVELPTAFSHDRMWWLAAITGNRMTATIGASSTAGYLRYEHTTPGLGDIAEMTGAVLCLCSHGVNDISLVGADSGDVLRDAVPARFIYRVAEMLDDWKGKGQDALIIGLPPYDHAANTTTAEAQAVRQLNRGLHGLALATRTPYYTPWNDTVVASTIPNAIPSSNTTYIQDTNEPHYLEAGSVLVTANAATEYESGQVRDRIKQS